MTIGGVTRVGKRAVVEAACVGAHVEIGEGAVVVRYLCLAPCTYGRTSPSAPVFVLPFVPHACVHSLLLTPFQHHQTQSARCVLKDCCRIEPGSVLPPDTVIPPFALVAGVPGAFMQGPADLFLSPFVFI